MKKRLPQMKNIREHQNLQQSTIAPGEMAHELRALTALTEALHSVPVTHPLTWHLPIISNYSYWGSDALFWPLQEQHVVHNKHTCRQNTHTHKKFFKKVSDQGKSYHQVVVYSSTQETEAEGSLKTRLNSTARHCL